jgi:pimeloyl-ACP methyl ester carboxylesterase
MDYLLTEAGERLPAMLQKCRIRQAILIGHSDGGTIALLTSALNPSMIKGAVVEAAHIFVEEITTAGIRKAVESYRTGNLRVALKKYHHDQVDRIFFRWADRWLSGEFKSWSIIDWLPSITCPLLVIQGARDEYGTPAQVDGIARHVSGPVATRLIPGCGHVPHFQAEKTVLKEMARFIEALLHDEGHVFS